MKPDNCIVKNLKAPDYPAPKVAIEVDHEPLSRAIAKIEFPQRFDWLPITGSHRTPDAFQPSQRQSKDDGAISTHTKADLWMLKREGSLDHLTISPSHPLTQSTYHLFGDLSWQSRSLRVNRSDSTSESALWLGQRRRVYGGI